MSFSPVINGISQGAQAAREAQGSAPGRDNDPERVHEAAKQFESLLLTQMLRSVREAGSAGWLGTGEDQAGGSAMELGEEQLAQALAEQGGLGLARLIVSGLQVKR